MPLLQQETNNLTPNKIMWQEPRNVLQLLQQNEFRLNFIQKNVE